jgi:hypothetical protein
LNKKIIIAIGIVVLVISGVISYGIKKSVTPTIQGIISYPDEPTIRNAKSYISSTSWSVPKNPEVVKEDLPPSGSPSAREVWKESPFVNLRTDMEKLHINQKYYQYLYGYTYLPVGSGQMKLTGNSNSYTYIQSIGAGCGSCETQYISMFIGSKTFTAESTWGSIFQRADGKGFYLTNFLTDFAVNTEKEILQKFEWNGNGFVETGEKTIKFKINLK